MSHPLPRRWKLLLLMVIAVSLACQVVPTPPPLRETPRRSDTPSPATTQLAPEASLPPTAAGTANATQTSALPSPGDLPPFPNPLGKPFANLTRPTWQANPSGPAKTLSLPADWDRVLNPQVAAGLTQQQRSRLAQAGFIILHSQEAQFGQIRERVALRYGQPYYLTTDAAAYALRLTLDELLIALEKEELRRRVAAITQAVLAEVLSYLELAPGGSLEADTHLAAAYLGVGLRLLDPQAPLDPLIEGPVQDQVEQILAGRGLEGSVLIPGFQDDFSAYRPAGHYAGDPDLQAYFRALTWFGRVVFPNQTNRGEPGNLRVPLILTLALRRAQIHDPGLNPDPTQALSAAQEWARVTEVLSFLLGPSLDDGPAEYAALMDQIYGSRLTIIGLADQNALDLFQLYVRELPPLQTSADPLAALRAQPAQRGWRFLGHGFQLDSYLLSRLAIPEAPGAPAAAQPRVGLDLFALLGSPSASAALQEKGVAAGTETNNEVERLQTMIDALGAEFWLTSAANAWWETLAGQVAEKDQRFPAHLRTLAWSYKDLNSALGVWAGLRRGPRGGEVAPEAPVQAASQPAGLVSAPPPAYVEPDPEVFYRLSHLANLTAEGLSQRGMDGVFAARPDRPGLKSLLLDLLDLGDRLQRLGDIASQELAGQAPTREDWALILAPLGPAEERPAPWPLPPAGIAAAQAGNPSLPQIASGWIDRIYVLVPLEDGLYVAQGGVASYYEVPISSAGPLTDEAWLRMLKNAPPEPLLAAVLYLPKGNPVDVLAFRIGDAYRLLPVAGRVNLRATPDRFAGVVQSLKPGDVFQIIAGPLLAGGLTWWQVQIPAENDQPLEGWLVEDPAWYERLW